MNEISGVGEAQNTNDEALPCHEGEANPVHHYRYCPRCAAKGTFNLNDYSFKCTACGFYFFLNSAAAVTAVIFNDKGELLTVRRGVEPGRGMIDLPGGFVDPGESVEQAMLREIKEELDLVPVSVSYIGSFPNRYLFSGSTVFTVDCVFRCYVDDFSTLKHLDDVMDVAFIKPEDIDLKAVPFVSVQQVIKKLIYEPANCR